MATNHSALKPSTVQSTAGVPATAAAIPRWQRPFEYGFWIVLILLNGIANSITTLIDIRRSGLNIASWEPAVWELSSGVIILLLVPMLVWFTQRYPMHLETCKQQLPRYLIASVVFSMIHIVCMVLLRKLAYVSQGKHYDFGYLPTEIFYEYMKDVRTYALILSVVEAYRFVQRRLQGEASLLGAPDEGEPVEPVDRPERFLVRKLGREFLIAAHDIEWMQASGNYVNLRVRHHDYPLRTTIGGIQSRLDPQRFARVHRSYIVNLAQIASIEPLDTGDARIHLKDATIVPCSRRYREPLRASVLAE